MEDDWRFQPKQAQVYESVHWALCRLLKDSTPLAYLYLWGFDQRTTLLSERAAVVEFEEEELRIVLGCPDSGLAASPIAILSEVSPDLVDVSKRVSALCVRVVVSVERESVVD